MINHREPAELHYTDADGNRCKRKAYVTEVSMDRVWGTDPWETTAKLLFTTEMETDGEVSKCKPVPPPPPAPPNESWTGPPSAPWTSDTVLLLTGLVGIPTVWALVRLIACL